MPLSDLTVFGDAERGALLYEESLLYPWLGDIGSKKRELSEFGIPPQLIDDFLDDRVPHGYYQSSLTGCLCIVRDAMMRLRPDGTTRLGLYIDSLRGILREAFEGGDILDFGCGAWPDASCALAAGGQYRTVLMDVRPLALAFAEGYCRSRNIDCLSLLVQQGHEFERVSQQPVMIVESTSLEHIRDVGRLWPELLDLLPSGGLILCNYTTTDWESPDTDGLLSAKLYAEEAEALALSVADRFAWEPEQSAWDLWRIR